TRGGYAGHGLRQRWARLLAQLFRYFRHPIRVGVPKLQLVAHHKKMSLRPRDRCADTDAEVRRLFEHNGGERSSLLIGVHADEALLLSPIFKDFDNRLRIGDAEELPMKLIVA